MADYGFDTTDLEKLIASLSRAQAPTDEDRSAARSQALQVAGLSLLGTPKGQVWGRAGQAGMNALAARQQYLSDIPKQRQAAIESAGKAMTLQEQLEALKERKQYEAGLRGGLLQAPGAEPTAGPTSIAPSMAQAFAAPPLPPGVTGVLNNPGGALPGLPPVSQLSQAPAVPPSSIEPSAPAPAATGTDPYSVLMKQAMQAQNVYQTTGNRYAQKQAEHFFGMAEKWREKMGAPQVGMVGGKPTLVRYGDYGGQQNVAGVEPTPEFATVDRGGSTDFVNKYTIPSTGQSFAKTPTFAEQTGFGTLALARQREAREAANVGRDDWVNDLDRGIQVNRKTGESRPIMAGGEPIAPKPKNAPDAYTKQIGGIVNVHTAIDNYLGELKGWSNADLANSTKRAQIGTAYNNTMLQLKEAYSLGVLNGPDYQILTTVLTDPLSIKGAVTSNKAIEDQSKQIRSVLKRNALNLAKVYKQPESDINAMLPDEAPPKAAKAVDALPPANSVRPGTQYRDTDTGKVLTSDGKTWR